MYIKYITIMAEEFQGNRNDFITKLKENKGVYIFKFTAEWCKPCQNIKKDVEVLMKNVCSNNLNIKCFEVDVDDDKSFDLFAYLKRIKMIRGIPTMLAYKKGNLEYTSDASISGTDLEEISAFFRICNKLEKQD